jgi:hypothetical protein
MLTWARAGWAEAKQITPVTIVRILSIRMVVAFEPPPNLKGSPLRRWAFCPRTQVTVERRLDSYPMGALASSQSVHCYSSHDVIPARLLSRRRGSGTVSLRNGDSELPQFPTIVSGTVEK